MEKPGPRIVEAVRRGILHDRIRSKTIDFMHDYRIGDELQLGTIQQAIFKTAFKLALLDHEARTNKNRGNYAAQQRINTLREDLGKKLKKDEYRLVEDTIKSKLESDRNSYNKHIRQIQNRPTYRQAIRDMVNDVIFHEGSPSRIRYAANTLSDVYLYTSPEDRRRRIKEELSRVNVKVPREKGPFEE